MVMTAVLAGQLTPTGTTVVDCFNSRFGCRISLSWAMFQTDMKQTECMRGEVCALVEVRQLAGDLEGLGESETTVVCQGYISRSR